MCKLCECGRTQPSLGLPGGKPKWCGKCSTKPSAAVNLTRPKCQCGRACPTFGYEERVPLFCKRCIPKGDMKVKNVMTTLCKCGKSQPWFGPDDGSRRAIWCSLCKEENAIDIHSKKCACGQLAYYVEGNHLFCGGCAPVGAKAIRNPCAETSCPGYALNAAYEGYCARCFVHLFPDKPATRNYKTKERLVIERLKPVLEAEFPHLETSFDRSVSGGCSRRRPDVFVDALTHCGIGEIDEEGHDRDAYCSCENRRNMEIFQDLGNRPLVIVRINPDAYTDSKGVRHGSCFGRDKLGKLVVTDEAEWKKRVDLFIERMRENLRNIPDREVTVEHLYYNGFFCE
jgi:hypothetical protein